MTIQIQPGYASGTVKAVGSKSEAHRMLICAALGDKPTAVYLSQLSQDLEATIAGLQALGAEIEEQTERYYVIPVNRWADQQPAEFDCGASGSTLRFLLPAAAALGAETTIHMAPRLSQRPLDPLLDQLRSHGCTVTWKDETTLSLSGRLTAGEYHLPGDLSSQFISGLLMALPLLSGDSRLVVDGPLESAGYVYLTQKIMLRFGMKLREEENGWFIPAVGYCSPGTLRVGGDWSNAAAMLALGILGGEGVTVTDLDPETAQWDRDIARLLMLMGGDLSSDEEYLGWNNVRQKIIAEPGPRKPVTVDARNIPDLVPVLAAAAAVTPGESRITGAARLRLKESDRLHTVTQVLNGLGADVEELEDGLVIRGKETLSGGTVDAWGDHRIVMAAAVASAACTGPVTITGAEAIKKSYPTFWDDLKTLGKTVTELP